MTPNNAEPPKSRPARPTMNSRPLWLFTPLTALTSSVCCWGSPGMALKMVLYTASFAAPKSRNAKPSNEGKDHDGKHGKEGIPGDQRRPVRRLVLEALADDATGNALHQPPHPVG